MPASLYNTNVRTKCLSSECVRVCSFVSVCVCLFVCDPMKGEPNPNLRPSGLFINPLYLHRPSGHEAYQSSANEK